jgi:hypothetical protein
LESESHDLTLSRRIRYYYTMELPILIPKIAYSTLDLDELKFDVLDNTKSINTTMLIFTLPQ